MSVDTTARFFRPPDVSRIRRNQRKVQLQRFLVIVRSLTLLSPFSGVASYALGVAGLGRLGGTPLVELYVIYNKLTQICAARGVNITRNLVGSYITSLEMAGFSITLLKLDDELTKYWDAPVNTPALRWGV